MEENIKSRMIYVTIVVSLFVSSFPATEDPISQSGMWINGGTTGINWTNVQSTAGLAFGTMPGNGAAPTSTPSYPVTGTWEPTRLKIDMHAANHCVRVEVTPGNLPVVSEVASYCWAPLHVDSGID